MLEAGHGGKQISFWKVLNLIVTNNQKHKSPNTETPKVSQQIQSKNPKREDPTSNHQNDFSTEASNLSDQGGHIVPIVL